MKRHIPGLVALASVLLTAPAFAQDGMIQHGGFGQLFGLVSVNAVMYVAIGVIVVAAMMQSFMKGIVALASAGLVVSLVWWGFEQATNTTFNVAPDVFGIAALVGIISAAFVLNWAGKALDGRPFGRPIIAALYLVASFVAFGPFGTGALVAGFALLSILRALLPETMIDAAAERLPAFLGRINKDNRSALLRGDRLAAAQQWWPAAKWPTLYKDIPADIRRPVVWDGRLLGGESVTWLAWSHFSAGLVTKIAADTGRNAFRIGFATFLLLFAIVGSQLFVGGREFPVWAQEVGAWHLVAGHYVLISLDFVFGAVAGLGLSAVAAALIVPAAWIFGFWRTTTSWWSDAGVALSTPTRDAKLTHKNRADIRGVEYEAYCRQVDYATTALAESPIINIGKAQGVFRARGDMEAPNRGQIIGLDADSICQHVLFLGSTGAQKTTLGIDPIIRRVMAANWGGRSMGAYICDGKGTLWRDVLPGLMHRADDIAVIGAGADQYGVNLLQDMTPLEVATVFKSVSGQVAGQSTDDFWPEQASILLMNAAAVARIIAADKKSMATPTWSSLSPYSLLGLALVATNPDVQAAMCIRVGEIEAEVRAAGAAVSAEIIEAMNAASWLMMSWGPMATETKSSIIANVNTVLGKLSGAGSLTGRFFTGKSDRMIDVDHALHGGIVMVAVGEAEFGMAGKVVNCWLKSRLFIAARRRAITDPAASKKFMCAFVVDEWQSLVTSGPDSDTSFWNVARSLGVFLVAATQGLSAMQQVLGEQATTNLLNLLRTKIVLKTEELATIRYVRELAGELPQGMVPESGFYPTQTVRELAIPDDTPDLPTSSIIGALWPVLPVLNTPAMRDPYAFDIGRVVSQAGFGQRSDPGSQIAEMNRVDDKNSNALIAGLQHRPKIEVDELLIGSGFAFAMVQRAGVDRTDIVDLRIAA